MVYYTVSQSPNTAADTTCGDCTWNCWVNCDADGTACDYTWGNWTGGTTSSATAVWGAWNNGYHTTVNITSDTVWVRWNITDGNVSFGGVDPTPITEERRLELEELERQRQEARLREEQEKAAAEIVAQELLLDLIGERELKVYKETGRLLVKGRKHDYMIWRDNKVQRIEKDKVHDLCVHLEGAHSFPKSDNVIALKLHIEHDEDGFNRKAHHVRTYDRPARLPMAANG
jgi:hypothetical protein